jgi:hypothetical protein
MQYIAIPGQGVPNADKLDQFYTKWGTPPMSGFGNSGSTSTWAPSNFDITGAGGLAVVATCKQYKTVLCHATYNSSDTSNHTRVCKTKKESRLERVETGAGLTPHMKANCVEIGGKGTNGLGALVEGDGRTEAIWKQYEFCIKIPATSFAQSNWITFPNINKLCEAQVVLL